MSIIIHENAGRIFDVQTKSWEKRINSITNENIPTQSTATQTNRLSFDESTQTLCNSLARDGRNRFESISGIFLLLFFRFSPLFRSIAQKQLGKTGTVTGQSWNPIQPEMRIETKNNSSSTNDEDEDGFTNKSS